MAYKIFWDKQFAKMCEKKLFIRSFYRYLWICNEVGQTLKDLGLVLVGLDVIGNYLTEINVTSPTCFQEYKNLCDIDVASSLLDRLEGMLSK